MPRLTVLNPEFGSQSCDLPDGTWTVGRGRRNQIVILDSSVSGVHCELLVHSPEVIVRDCGSRNGTFVNGVRVSAQRGVSHGQTLRVGIIEARVEIEPPLHDGSRATTAFDDYRRWLRHSDPGSDQPSPPPVTFRAIPPSGTPAATQNAAPPAAVPIPVPAPPLPGIKRFRTFPLWAWISLLIALLVALLALTWSALPRPPRQVAACGVALLRGADDPRDRRTDAAIEKDRSTAMELCPTVIRSVLRVLRISLPPALNRAK